MRYCAARLLIFALCFFAFAAMLPGQASAVPSRITARVDASQMVTLHSGVHPLAQARFDRGEVSGDTRTDRVQMVLSRSAAQETALRTMLDQQQDSASPQFHQWLTPSAFGRTYGPSDGDLAVLTSWLQGQGFSAVKVNPGRTVVEFSGTAAQMKSAFHVSLHHYLVNGVTYTANAAEPQLPAALAPIVAGFGSLNNFPRRANNISAGTVRRDKATGLVTKLAPAVSIGNNPGPTAPNVSQGKPSPDFTFISNKQTFYGITPYDFATIYNVLPLWNASTPNDGTGQVIAITGRTDINPVDFINFRNIFGLPTGAAANATGSSYLNIIYNGPNPGINGDEDEADIDTQWSGAVARGATIDFVTSADTITTFGIDLSAQYIVDNNLAPVMSTSYGACELELGTAGNLEYLQLWEQASAQGITAMVSSGDSGNAGCENGDPSPSTLGASVSGFQSTPYNVSVGGTDFNIAQGATAYFSSTNNATTQASALSYVPEVPWNDSCTNFQIPLFAPWTGFTAEQVCNSSTARNDGLVAPVGGSGGPSSCISSNGYASSSCTGGYAKPSWQTGTGVPADGVRDTPDVSLFASNGFWGAFYLICEQDASANGTCDVSSPYQDFQAFGGTSIASPAFAGMMALVNQKTGSRQGNANYVLYKLFNNQTTAGTSCNSNGSPSSSCVFNDIAVGTIAQPCSSGAPNCVITTAGDQVGVLKGGAAKTGYDTATGLGSVNAANLVNNWSTASSTATTTKLTLSPTTFVHGAAVSAGVTVTSATGTPTGDVSILGATANGAATYGTLASGAYNTTLDTPLTGVQSVANTNTLPGGSYNVTAHYGGSSVYAESDSAPVAVTVMPEATTTTVTPILLNQYNGAITPVTGGTAAYGTPNFVRFKVVGASGQGYPSGTLTVTDTAGAYDGGVPVKLNSTGSVDDLSTSLTPGTHTLTASYSGDASFNKSSATSGTFTITKALTSGVLYALPSTGTTAGTVTLEVLVNTTSYGYAAPTGVVTLSYGTTVLGSATLTQGYVYGTFYNQSVGELVIPASMLPAGASTITAAYAGDGNYGPTNASASVSLSAGTLTASSTVLTVTPTTYVTGGSFSFTATVTPSSPVPTGNVSLFIGGTSYGAFTLANGTVTASGVPSGLLSGSNSVYVVYSGDTHYAASSSNVVTLSVAQQGFTLIAPQTPATVTAPGATSTGSTLAVVPVTGLSGTLPVSFACTAGLPSLAACVFSPASVTIGPNSATTILTITTAAPVASLMPLRWMMFGGAPITLAGLLLWMPGVRRRRFGSLLSLCLVLGALTALSGCGGGTSTSGGGTTTHSSPGTPIGSYSVVVTATSGSGAAAVSSSATVTLVVN